jgi:hypothetical protein
MIALVVFLACACTIAAAATARKRDDVQSAIDIADHDEWMAAMRAEQ